MAFTPKEWTFSNYTPKETGYKTPKEGKNYLIILSAELVNDVKMRITFKTLDGENAVFSVWYNLYNADMTFNDRSLGTLNSLGYSCCGQHTTLMPDDLVGCVVIGDIKLNPNKSDPNKPPYTNIYHYDPITEDEMYCSERQDQFYLPSEEKEE
jgi:hypothetical protein